MPNRYVQKDGTTVELLTRVPVNRGSLLKGIDNLLKTIETSENAVMIPTLLKDKVRVDACELLFVAKILKASILGHSDLVEFYMNHIGHTASSLQQHAAAITPTGSASIHQNELLSPSTKLPTSPMASPLLSHAISNHQREQQAAATAAALANTTGATVTSTTHVIDQNGPDVQRNLASLSSLSTCSTSSSMNSQQSSGAMPTGSNLTGHYNNQGSLSGSTSWASAPQSFNNGNINSSTSLSSGASFNSLASSNDTPTTSIVLDSTDGHIIMPTNGPLPPLPEVPNSSITTAGKPQSVRQAQPPSLLQLTTTNNHLNSVSDLFQTPHSANQPITSQVQHQQQSNLNNTLSQTLEGLSISTTAANSTSLDQSTSSTSTPSASNPPSQQQQQQTNGLSAVRQELRSSRSAGCLFRANSGASSPRTPNQTTPSTPFPQAETLAGLNAANGLVGDPSALVKLLLQVEQLKSSISHCTSLLESVVELYKKSIDNIA